MIYVYFASQFMEVVQRVGEQANGSPSNLESVRNELHDKFNKQGYSDYIVVYLRLITSGHLQTDQDFYQNFIEGPPTVTEFCRQVGTWMFELTFCSKLSFTSSAVKVFYSTILEFLMY